MATVVVRAQTFSHASATTDGTDLHFTILNQRGFGPPKNPTHAASLPC